MKVLVSKTNTSCYFALQPGCNRQLLVLMPFCGHIVYLAWRVFRFIPTGSVRPRRPTASPVIARRHEALHLRVIRLHAAFGDALVHRRLDVHTVLPAAEVADHTVPGG